MKKLMLTFCLVLVGTGAFAQKFDEPESGDWAFGLNLPQTWGDDYHLGIQPKVQFYATSRFRMEASFGYYFKQKERIDWDVNFNFHYTFPIKDTGLWIYPLIGVQALHRHYTYDKTYKKANKGYDDKMRVGLNVGAGVQYDIDERLYVNAEMKYTYLNDFDRGNLCVGIAYRF
ncbi:MAG: porin family protein [Bacteroidaceae bacterium]|nr:porin family protein [Bacteroidaceae bacterium]